MGPINLKEQGSQAGTPRVAIVLVYQHYHDRQGVTNH
jgi:hypothetical protein